MPTYGSDRSDESLLNILLVGEESAGAKVLRALACGGHRVVGVMASPAKRPAGGPTMWQLAERMGYRTWPAALVKDPAFAHQVRSEGVDILLNVHSLYVIKPEVVAAPRIGSFNLHPGPLPRYAGLNAVSWAIYRGETTHGVTVHKMAPEIDAGPIVYQTSFPIKESDTALTVFEKCVTEGVALILRLLKTASTGPACIPLAAQDLAQREYFGARPPREGRLDWNLPARQVVDWVRASDFFPFPSPWGYPTARVNGVDAGIVKASLTGQRCSAAPGSVSAANCSAVQVACRDEWISVHKVLVDGRYCNALDVLRLGGRPASAPTGMAPRVAI